MLPFTPQLLAPRAKIAAAGGADAAETTAFLARTSGLDGPHIAAYKALINGLVADGIFSQFDLLYVLATQDRATARLNLVSSSFPLTDVGTANVCPFTADRGISSDSYGSSNYMTTSFNPSTNAVKMTLNSGHIGLYNGASGIGTTVGCCCGTNDGTNIAILNTNQFAPDGGNCNDTLTLSDASAQVVPAWFSINRSGAASREFYYQGSSLTSDTRAPTALTNSDFRLLTSGDTLSHSQYNIAACSLGASLTAGQQATLNTRIHAFMTAVGAP